ncbi:MAG: enoyl-CoA hydratase/isomerase family protein [Myxococcales bacterium]|nr:enoyl-CoA hydratase/isomerase family protein [Myxococcales bacterium]
MANDLVTYLCKDHIAWVTLNRPEARNALSQAVRDQLREAFQRFAEEDDARVMVLSGAGDVFCAGGDLKEMAQMELKVPGPDFVPYLNRTIHTDKPAIAMVQGGAYAGGFLLAQMCDLVIAEEGAKFAITEARWGRGAPWAAPLPWLIPPRVAMELLLTAAPIDAARAREVGLVNRVVPAEALREETEKLAASIARNAPLSVRAGKAMVYATLGADFMGGLAHGERFFEKAYLSEDAQEGPRAFRERRDPVWKGR